MGMFDYNIWYHFITFFFFFLWVPDGWASCSNLFFLSMKQYKRFYSHELEQNMYSNTTTGIKPVSCQFLQSPPSVQTHSGVPSVTNWSALVPMWMVLMEQAGCRWPCWSRCYSNMHLMTCRPRGHQFIMANKTDLEYIMFPVNVMLRHQRPERTSNKNTEQSFRANECKKRRFTVGHAESNLFGW